MSTISISKRLLYGAILGVAALAMLLIGFVLADQALFPSATLKKAKTAIREALRPSDGSDASSPPIVWSTFVPFERQELDVPVQRAGSGGGLTSIGDTLIILTHEGKLFGFREGEALLPLDIALPDNGHSDYVTASSGKFSHLTHAAQYVRYNDVLFFGTQSQNALAISYTEWHDDENCYTSTISTVEAPDDPADILSANVAASDWRVLFRTKPCLPLKDESRAIEGHMAGGRIAFMPPDKIILGSGDYHWDGMYAPAIHAQDPSNDYGKIIEIDADGGESRHLSIGNRNVQGVAVDNTGRIWAVEHGPRGGDELNLIKENSNYGWPLATLGTRYNKLPVPTAETVGRHSGYDGPTFAWLPSIGVSNVTEIRNFDPTWDGDLLVASLSAQSLYRLRIADDNVRFAEQIRLDRRIRYAYQFNDRLFALLTDQNKLLLLRKTEKPPESLALDEIVGKMKLAEDRKSRLRTNLDACARCHSYSTSDNVRSPNLGNVFGRNIASTNFGHNSAALLNSPGTWDEPLLRRYLTDPQNFAYGTTMPDPNLSDDAISDLIEAMRLLHQPE